MARIRATQQRYKSKVRVESNAAQQYISQFLAAEGVRVDSHTTTRQKHLGVEALAVEFEQGRWLVPDAPASRDLIREMLAYSPASHTGDRLVALWLAREAANASSSFDPLPMFRTSDSVSFDASGRPRVVRGEFPEGCWIDVARSRW